MTATEDETDGKRCSSRHFCLPRVELQIKKGTTRNGNVRKKWHGMIIPSGGKDTATFVVLRETGGNARHQNLSTNSSGTMGYSQQAGIGCYNLLAMLGWCGWKKTPEIRRAVAKAKCSAWTQSFERVQRASKLQTGTDCDFRRNSIARHQSKKKETLALLVSESYPTALQQPPP